MSNTMYSLATTFCCVLIICSLTRLISPSKSTSKIISQIIGVFMLLTVISPIADFFSNINYDELQISAEDIESQITLKTDENVLRITGDYLTEYIAMILENADVEYTNIETIMSSSDSGIYVEGVNIYIEQADKVLTEVIRESVLTAVGVEPMVFTSQGN